MIRASVHQRSGLFTSKGKQCMTNSIAAILQRKDLSAEEWTAATLDEILTNGDNLYTIHNVDTYLMLEDLKPACPNYYKSLHIGSALTGTTLNVHLNKLPCFTLEEAFNTVLPNDESSCIFTMGSTNPSYSTTIVHESNTYYVFDPHSRSEMGMSTPDGCAVLTIHNDIKPLSSFFRHISALIDKKDIPFDVANITSTVDQADDLACQCYRRKYICLTFPVFLVWAIMSSHLKVTLTVVKVAFLNLFQIKMKVQY